MANCICCQYENIPLNTKRATKTTYLMISWVSLNPVCHVMSYSPVTDTSHHQRWDCLVHETRVFLSNTNPWGKERCQGGESFSWVGRKGALMPS